VDVVEDHDGRLPHQGGDGGGHRLGHPAVAVGGRRGLMDRGAGASGELAQHLVPRP
jgi:hypothetical protein